jgi:hypothetical protein
MKIVAAAFLTLAVFGAGIQPRVTRVTLGAMEQSMDTKVVEVDKADPAYLLGTTRGVYLNGYGAVFTSEVDLLASSAPNPFRPAYTKQDVQRLKLRKQQRIAILRSKMRELLISSAASLDAVPATEQIALAVTLPYYRWEDKEGMPRQILMHAPKQVLLDGARGNTAAVDAAMIVREF